MMVVSSKNQEWLFRTGVEDLLEDEFKNDAIVYFGSEYMGQGKQAIRISKPTSDQEAITKNMVTDRKALIVTLEYPMGSNERISEEQQSDMFERIKRVLVNNCAYYPSDVYRWHGGSVEGTNPDPDRETSEDGDLVPPDTVDLESLIWAVTISEVLPQ